MDHLGVGYSLYRGLLFVGRRPGGGRFFSTSVPVLLFPPPNGMAASWLTVLRAFGNMGLTINWIKRAESRLRVVDSKSVRTFRAVISRLLPDMTDRDPAHQGTPSLVGNCREPERLRMQVRHISHARLAMAAPSYLSTTSCQSNQTMMLIIASPSAKCESLSRPFGSPCISICICHGW